MRLCIVVWKPDSAIHITRPIPSTIKAEFVLQRHTLVSSNEKANYMSSVKSVNFKQSITSQFDFVQRGSLPLLLKKTLVGCSRPNCPHLHGLNLSPLCRDMSRESGGPLRPKGGFEKREIKCADGAHFIVRTNKSIPYQIVVLLIVGPIPSLQVVTSSYAAAILRRRRWSCRSPQRRRLI